MKIISLMLPKGSHMKKKNPEPAWPKLVQNQPKYCPKIAQKRQFQTLFCPFWRRIVHGRFRWVSMFFLDFSCRNRLVQVQKSMLKHRTHPGMTSHPTLKVDFSIQLRVKFQILINFLQQMLDSAQGIVTKSAGHDFQP